MEIKMNNKVLSLYDWFLIVGVIVTNAIYSIMTGTLDVLGSIAGITGVLCVVLVAKGSILNYVFGLVNVSLYAYISYKASLYGDAALNALYYVPMQFIGWWQWRRRGAAVSEAEAGDNGVQVKARRFTWNQRAILFICCAVAVVGGSGLHGTVDVMDNNECSKRSDVVHMCLQRGGSCGSDGDHVGFLSSQLNKWFEGVEEAQQVRFALKIFISRFFLFNLHRFSANTCSKKPIINLKI